MSVPAGDNDPYATGLAAPATPRQATPRQATADRLPLVVDMDGFLVRADLEAEAAIADLEIRVRGFTLALRGGRPATSDASGRIDPAGIADFARKGADVSRLPLDAAVVDYVTACASTGRELHLITSAAQEIADAVAARVGGFASATGTPADADSASRTAAARLAVLAHRFPGGFAYAGRSPEVIERAASVVLIDTDTATARSVLERGGTVEAGLSRPHQSPAAIARIWMKTLRCHQWSKNALLFVPLVLGHAFTDAGAVAACLAGFLLLGLLASGTYIINDLVDLDADRRHATKRRRPLARGDIKAGPALIVACVLIASSLAAAWALSTTFFAALTGYLLTTLAYSFYLKRLHLIDVFVLAALFTSRIAMGIALAGVAPSPWLLTFTMFFFLSLSLAKRHVEIVNAAEQGLHDIPGRDYRTSDLPLTVALGVGCNAVAMLVIFLYLALEAMPMGFYRQPYWLWAAGFVVFLWSLRIWSLSHRGRLDADPVAFAIRDRASIVLGLVVVAVFGLAL